MDKTKYIRVVTVLGFMMMASSCVYDPYYHGQSPYYSDRAYYPYDYYYYPSARVYFQYSTGFYFFISDGIWVRNRTLPPHFRLNVRDRVPLRAKTDKPYLKNPQHTERFRPRPDLKSTPAIDRSERESLRRTYKEQLYKRQQKPVKEKKDKRDKDKRRR